MAYRFHFLPQRSDYDNGSILDILSMIRNGDVFLKNKFIGDYRPFIKKVIKKTTRITGHIEDSDEYSVALIAFNEAIDCYNESKNCKFIHFAEQVIRRRIIDFIRLNSRINNKEFPFTYFTDEGDNCVDEIYLRNQGHTEFERIEIIQEMKKLVVLLKDFDIDIRDLPGCTPKHLDSRELSLKIANIIVNNRNLMEKLVRKKSIPIADVVKVFNVHPKTIYRHKKYIISLCLILGYELEHLKEVIWDGRRGFTDEI